MDIWGMALVVWSTLTINWGFSECFVVVVVRGMGGVRPTVCEARAKCCGFAHTLATFYKP